MKYKSINTELSRLGMCIAGAYKWLRWWCRLLAGCLYRSCVKTQTVSRAGTRDLTLHCRTWSPCGPRHLGNISQGIQQHGDRKQSHPHTSSRSSRWGDQNSGIVFMCKASLFTYFVLKLIFAAIIDIFHTFQDFASMGQFALVTRHGRFFREEFD